MSTNDLGFIVIFTVLLWQLVFVFLLRVHVSARVNNLVLITDGALATAALSFMAASNLWVLPSALATGGVTLWACRVEMRRAARSEQ